MGKKPGDGGFFTLWGGLVSIFLEVELNDLSYKIRGAIFCVHRELGPGLLESVYEKALSHELTSLGLQNITQVELPVIYKDHKLEIGFRVDILVEDRVIIEIKSLDALHEKHKKVTLNYLKLAGLELAFLVNFNVLTINKESLIRIIN